MVFQLSLLGFITVRDAHGADFTPRGAKTRALLAMLALSPDRCRSRRWLEAKLWSDRGEAQAQGSLRQALFELRQAFPSHEDVVAADRERIRLVPERVRIDVIDDLDECIDRCCDGSELMEGLTIRDEAFQDWIRMERSRFLRRLESYVGRERDQPGHRVTEWHAVPRAHLAERRDLIDLIG